MKLFEVLYPKCKNCGWDFSKKPFRDHRFGVCDNCAFPNKKDVKETVRPYSDFEEDVKEILWREYQHDPVIPAAEEYPEQMSDEDFATFEDHVRDVMTFARQYRIRDPQRAVDLYHEEIVKVLRPHSVH